MDNKLKEIVDSHKKLLVDLNKILALSNSFKQNINNSINVCLKNKTLDILKENDLSVLKNKNVRIKLLQENNYNDLASLYNASLADLTSIKGISDTSARNIKTIVNNCYEENYKNQKIKLSGDDIIVDTVNLLKSIYIYLNTDDLLNEANKLYLNNKNKVEKELSLINKSDSLFSIFSSSDTKQKTNIAIEDIKQSYLSGFYIDGINILRKISDVCNTSNKVIYDNFIKEPLKYIDEINKINPDCLEKSDKAYNLPEKLAYEVENETYYKDELKCTLRKYQEYGVKFILHQKRVLLGDEMGLGKTIQAIGVMASLLACDKNHFLVVCPASVIVNWCKEIKEKSTLNVFKLHGENKQIDFNSWLENGGVAVCTYEGTSDFTFPTDFKLPLLIVDEAHYIKNDKTKRTKSVSKICDISERILFMTGTALENNLEEMISLLYLLRADIAARAERMLLIGNSSKEKFKELISPVYFRRKREDVLSELPDKIENKEWCTLLKEEKIVYQGSLLSKNYANIRRVSFNMDDLSKSSKALRLKEIVQEAKEDNRKVIVFSFFLDTIAKVCKLFEGECMGSINGSLSPSKRQEIIDKFNDAPSGTVLPAQIQSGGTGLNIQCASVVVICEPQFKPSIENQAISRSYRMGQSRTVLVYRLLCENTIDEKIVELLENKQKIFDEYADTSKSGIESIELDEHSFSKLIDEEIENIKKEN